MALWMVAMGPSLFTANERRWFLALKKKIIIIHSSYQQLLMS